MKVYTVVQISEGRDFDFATDITWNESFTSLHKAKWAIEEESWEAYCTDWEDAVENGWGEPETPPFIEWYNLNIIGWLRDESYAGEWLGERKYDLSAFGIQETELV